jgi:biotin carboxyl carrier protein
MAKKEKFEILNVNGTEYLTNLDDKFRNRKNYETPNPNLVFSVIPGTIREIFVKEGQKVKEGSKMLILEAMKMRNVVEAPVDGTIKSINVKQEEMVAKNVLLIEIE